MAGGCPARITNCEPNAVVGDDERQACVLDADAEVHRFRVGVLLDVGECLGDDANDRGVGGGRDVDVESIPSHVDVHAACAKVIADLEDRVPQAARWQRRGKLLQAPAHERVGRGHGVTQPLTAGDGDRRLGLGVQERELARGQREVLRKIVMNQRGQARSFALELGPCELHAELRGGDPGRQEVSDYRQHRGRRGLQPDRSRAAATMIPITPVSARNGSTSHELAGGWNGFSTSQLPSSWKISGTPLDTARRHASASNAILSTELVRVSPPAAVA